MIRALILVSLIPSAFGKIGLRFVRDGIHDRSLSTILETAAGEEVVESIFDFQSETVYLVHGEGEGFVDDPGVELHDSTLVSQHLDSAALWNLDRVDDVCGRSDGVYQYLDHDPDDEDKLSQVVVYILDTGVNPHVDLGGRLMSGRNFVSDCVNDVTDERSHGTFVATLVAGDRAGTCRKDCLIYPVKVVDASGSGSVTNVIRGIAHAVQHCLENAPQKCIIVNLSLGTWYNSAMNQMVKFATSHGVMVFVSAGNQFSDACNVSPASASSAWTVGASNRYDELAYFSNSGDCVDFYSPGRSVLGGNLNGGFSIKSGTSMASLTAAGLVAKFWLEHDDLVASEMSWRIRRLVEESPKTDLAILVRHHGWRGPSSVSMLSANETEFI